MVSTPIIQFGTSRFLQAHADLFLSQARDAGQNVGPVTIVQSSGHASRASRLKALSQPFPVRIEGIQDGATVQETETVRSVVRCLSTSENWDEVERVFTQEVEIVLSNTGDKGYDPQPCDTALNFDQAMSYPAKLLHLLRARFEHNAAPIQIMPMELIVDNGLVLKERVKALAADDSDEFQTYLDKGVTWVNSLVDRIVSQPLEPAGAIAEPYALWAIEDQCGLILPCKHPSIQIVPALKDIEALKLFVLNLGHTFLAERWLVSNGAENVFVRDLLNDDTELNALKEVWNSEVRPAFIKAGLQEQFDEYVNTTIERFANPFLDHRIADIAQNHVQKVERRIAAMLAYAKEQGDLGAKPILTGLVMKYVVEDSGEKT
ncbi:MAG: mannitol dehydrogenase family protein [Lentilitoribacter sp.]